jgi:hypothetical protein
MDQWQAHRVDGTVRLVLPLMLALNKLCARLPGIVKCHITDDARVRKMTYGRRPFQTSALFLVLLARVPAGATHLYE